MPLYVKIDFRSDGRLSGWYTRDLDWPNPFAKCHSTISETRVREVLIAIANEIDPLHPTKVKEIQ
jgi:hypothetical protein